MGRGAYFMTEASLEEIEVFLGKPGSQKKTKNFGECIKYLAYFLMDQEISREVIENMGKIYGGTSQFVHGSGRAADWAVETMQREGLSEEDSAMAASILDAVCVNTLWPILGMTAIFESTARGRAMSSIDPGSALFGEALGSGDDSLEDFVRNHDEVRRLWRWRKGNNYQPLPGVGKPLPGVVE